MEIDVGDWNDENRKDALVKDENLEYQEDVDVLEVVDVLALLAAISRGG